MSDDFYAGSMVCALQLTLIEQRFSVHIVAADDKNDDCRFFASSFSLLLARFIHIFEWFFTFYSIRLAAESMRTFSNPAIWLLVFAKPNMAHAFHKHMFSYSSIIKPYESAKNPDDKH